LAGAAHFPTTTFIMSTDAPFTPPRKKVQIFWWLGAIFVILLLLFLLQLFGPNPPIVVSPKTTFITGPLGPNRLPDFEQHLRDELRAGVTPENNAAVLFWEALFPAEVPPQYWEAVTAELGLEQIPPPDLFQELHNDSNRVQIQQLLQRRIAAEQAVRADANTPAEDVAIGTDDASEQSTADFETVNPGIIEEVLNQTTERPWRSDQLPPLVQWVHRNKQSLDLIVEGSRRPRFYAPSPTLVNGKPDLLIEMLLPQVQAMREAARVLSARAMWHAGERQVDSAWQDLLALHRISHLLTQGHTLVEQLVAFAISSNACNGTLALLDHGSLTVEQARRIHGDLAALPKFSAVARTLDQSERLAAIDAFLRLGSGGGDKMFTAISGVQDNDFGNSVFNVISVDWNFVLRETNRWYDRLAAAAKLPDSAARATALQQIEADMQQLFVEFRAPTSWLAGAVNRQQRSKLVSSMMLGLFLPAINGATAAEDRANAMLELTRLAAALAVYRAEHGAYPDKLDDLVPSVIETLPVDLYSQPIVYKGDGKGYLLYSRGANGTDEGGSNSQLRILKGRPLSETDVTEDREKEAGIPIGSDDFSIRVPRPAFEFPKLTVPPGEP
jgi:hypothetical protein